MRFLGFSTHFGEPPDDPHDSSRLMEKIDSGPIAHRVEMFSYDGFFDMYIREDPLAEWDYATWLSISSQLLRTITHGGVFRDDDGILTTIREKLACGIRTMFGCI